MILFKKGKDLRIWLENQQTNKKSIGFVPTMGALHAGHLSLVYRSREDNDVTVCSLFVNPTQFNDPRDFEGYPLSPEQDIDLLEEAGCDVIFMPSVKEMYPEGLASSNAKHYDLGYLENILEGEFRPGHYQGVCTIVHKLLDIVWPDRLYLGQKDYQQCMVIKKMLENLCRDSKTAIVVCPTMREKNGLAMSSRNLRLSPEQKEVATTIFMSLQWVNKNLHAGIESNKLIHSCMEKLEMAGLKPEYVEIAKASSLEHIDTWDGKEDVVILAAAWVGGVRLIDNITNFPA